MCVCGRILDLKPRSLDRRIFIRGTQVDILKSKVHFRQVLLGLLLFVGLLNLVPVPKVHEPQASGQATVEGADARVRGEAWLLGRCPVVQRSLPKKCFSNHENSLMMLGSLALAHTVTPKHEQQSCKLLLRGVLKPPCWSRVDVVF